MVRKNKRRPALWGTSLVPAEPSGAQIRQWGEKQPVLVQRHGRERCSAPQPPRAEAFSRLRGFI